MDETPEMSLRDIVREQVRQRRLRACDPSGVPPRARMLSLREMLRERFGLAPADVYELADQVDYTGLFQIASLPAPACLRDTPWTPRMPAALQSNHDIFAAIRHADLLVHHPYARASKTAWNISTVAAAAADPQNHRRKDDRVSRRRRHAVCKIPGEGRRGRQTGGLHHRDQSAF